MGLVGLLVVLVILGAMAAVAMSSLGGDDSPVPRRLSPPDTALPPGGRPVGGAGAASAEACRMDVATLERAMAISYARSGAHPTDLSQLVDQGMVSALPDRAGYVFTAEVVDGRGTGRVLVNGRPGPQGCAT